MIVQAQVSYKYINIRQFQTHLTDVNMYCFHVLECTLSGINSAYLKEFDLEGNHKLRRARSVALESRAQMIYSCISEKKV
jgi:hypothetical protein